MLQIGEVFNHTQNYRRSQTVSRNESFRSRTVSGSGLNNEGGSSMGSITPPPTLERGTSVTSNSSASSSYHGNSTNATNNSITNNSASTSTPDILRKGSFSNDSTSGDSEEQARLCLIQAMELTQNENLKLNIIKLLDNTFPGGRNLGPLSTNNLNGRIVDKEVYHTIVAMEDYLWKKGKSFFHMLSKRYYLLSGNCVYYYSHKNDVRPRGVIFLTGSIVERCKDEDMQMKGYFGFELLHQDLTTGEHHRHDHRILYCKSEENREKWVTALQHAAHVVPIEEEYVIGKELGRGRFSIVCECVHKVSGIHCAVKIIDKNTIEKDEKELLRTEIAVLKLVNHPNIIRMEGIYESKQYIYIVMEMLKGGELFERIVGRPRFTELEAARLLRPLLESVAYLHDLGIVHRDLKPENILCGEDLEDIKIADFGLSKMILPKEKMDAACGTLSYVAPEVLTMQGYGKEADLWSVGVIMFLLLCGKLPFDGDDHNEIIKSTIQADLKVNPSVWNKLSDEAKSLMTSLLNKSAKDRITARDSLKHPFMLLYPSMTSHKRHVQFDRFNSRAMSLTASTRNGIPASGPSPSPSPSPSPANNSGSSGKNTPTNSDTMAKSNTTNTNSPRSKSPTTGAMTNTNTTTPTAITTPIAAVAAAVTSVIDTVIPPTAVTKTNQDSSVSSSSFDQSSDSVSHIESKYSLLYHIYTYPYPYINNYTYIDYYNFNHI